MKPSANQDVVIRVENLYKEYRLGQISHGTLYRDLQSWWAGMRGKEDPNSIISTVQSSALNPQPSTLNPSDNPHMLALNDVSFEVKRGEVLGIIGRNGAGKSTLLKILSEVTSPTKGQVKIKGRVASLLEVGTGFHPELTGGENVYLNGAILGMTKKEIGSRFDEIVAFAEIEKFIDTPVKRYSSGMYVRLAFAVAAHLDPEILIVDEVLAVGDVQFQKKCLGKMGDVAKQGRTVLFVSHNMQAISTLTSDCLVLSGGKLMTNGKTSEAIRAYLSEGGPQNAYYEAPPSIDRPSITKVKMTTSLPNNTQISGEAMKIQFEVNTPYSLQGAAVSFQAMNSFNIPILHLWVFDSEQAFCREPGKYELVCNIPKMRLYMGKYTLKIHFGESSTGRKIETIDDICPFEVVMYGKKRDYQWIGETCNYVEDCEWDVACTK